MKDKKFKCELRFLAGTGNILTVYTVGKDGSETELFGRKVSDLCVFHLENGKMVRTGRIDFGYRFSLEHGECFSFEVQSPSFIRGRGTKTAVELAANHFLFIHGDTLYMAEGVAGYRAENFVKKGSTLNKEEPAFFATARIDCEEYFTALKIKQSRTVVYMQDFMRRFESGVLRALSPENEPPASDEQLKVATQKASDVLHAMYAFSDFWEHVKASRVVTLCNQLQPIAMEDSSLEQQLKDQRFLTNLLVDYLRGKDYMALYNFGQPGLPQVSPQEAAKLLSFDKIKQRLNTLADEGLIGCWMPEDSDEYVSFNVWDRKRRQEVIFYPLEKNGVTSLRNRIHISPNIPKKWRPDAGALAEYLWKACDKNDFLTVNEIVLVWHGDADGGVEDPERDRLADDYGDDYAYFTAMDGEDKLAVTWSARGIVVINCGNVYNVAHEIAMEDKRDGIPGYLGTDYIREVLKSIIQTLRQLMFATNIVVTSKEYPELDGTNEDVDKAVIAYTDEAYERGCNEPYQDVFPNI